MTFSKGVADQVAEFVARGDLPKVDAAEKRCAHTRCLMQSVGGCGWNVRMPRMSLIGRSCTVRHVRTPESAPVPS